MVMQVDIIPATGGDLQLDGHEARHFPPERRRVGLVYQHGYLFPHLSVQDNVAYGAADPIVSLYEGNRARQIADGADPARTRIVPNGIDTRRFSPEPSPQVTTDDAVFTIVRNVSLIAVRSRNTSSRAC